MPELIHDLRARGVRVVGLTDISPGHLRLIARYPAVKALEEVVASCRTAYRKPEPEAFRAALAAGGATPAETFFTDDIAANVEGARRLGIRAVVFPGAEDLRIWLGI
jgi:HAD superfamily hydrolase (TIGR01509 family)